jgi:hypothetical protein
MGDFLERAYGWLDTYRVSPTSLAIATVVFAFVFLFALREAAAWFFKTGQIKKDLRRLEKLSLRLEGEIRALRDLLQAQAIAPKAQAGERDAEGDASGGIGRGLTEAAGPSLDEAAKAERGMAIGPEEPAHRPLFRLTR